MSNAIVPANATALPVDPIFALIEAHRAATVALNAVPGDIEDEAPEAAAEAVALAALLDSEPTTPAGLCAFAEYSDAMPSGFEADALAIIAKASRAVLMGPAPADPIFAAIEKHKVALAATAAAPTSDEVDALADVALDLLHELAEVVPLTVPGLRAMVQHFDEIQSTKQGDAYDVGLAFPAIAQAMAKLFPAA